MNALLIVLALFAAIWVCAYHRYSALGWTAVIAVGLGDVVDRRGDLPQSERDRAQWTAFAIGAALLNPSPLRRALLSKPLLAVFRRILPQVSQTEQEALDAGTVWWDGDLFSGKPGLEQAARVSEADADRGRASLRRRPGRGSCAQC